MCKVCKGISLQHFPFPTEIPKPRFLYFPGAICRCLEKPYVHFMPSQGTQTCLILCISLKGAGKASSAKPEHENTWAESPRLTQFFPNIIKFEFCFLLNSQQLRRLWGILSDKPVLNSVQPPEELQRCLMKRI